jgi:hypothetical protein
MSAFGKLRCSNRLIREGPVWAVISESDLSLSRKRALAARQKAGKVGSFLPFPALWLNVRSDPEVTGLHAARSIAIWRAELWLNWRNLMRPVSLSSH